MHITHPLMVIDSFVKYESNIKANRRYRSDTKTQKTFNMTLRSKVNVNVMYVHDTVKYGKPISNKKNSYWPDMKTCKKAVN